ncbi:ATP-dependent DNA helicase RecQ [Alkalibaculum bacchi]|uniref:DNA helicase RecQ n=1 Tax=Alkalibaculum bacchi TaxID=645887 RepID=A0A366I8W2_9FIRM|nr:DNA helicase RecQ [Alkalibaculum bacchi]RBP65966.1 ATP-dependent DNA helicase RecQ [Alkalibaculum bacchi]
MVKDKYGVLKEYFGYEQFRMGQEELIDSILQGKDTLGIMPTGAGKSICFQIPAVLLEGITLVISPLISLMKDQVTTLNQAGIPSAFLNSSLSNRQYSLALRYAKEGRYKIIYVAPERLTTAQFLKFASESKISMISVDEAHCVSQWGQDFRPSYLKIKEFIHLLPSRPVISAFTATATEEVREDIIHILQLKKPNVTTTGFDRPNLFFAVRKPSNKYTEVLKILKAHLGESGVIYCATRKNVEEVCNNLNLDGYKATRYHAGLSDQERKDNQEAFVYDNSPIMVATNAFGMGIDKSNVSFVIHYNMPKNLESYYQEAGRAGRDGEPADCILLYHGQDVITNQFLIEHGSQNEELDEETSKLVKEKDRERLKIMTYYCHTRDCLREYILNYFDDKSENHCGNCSNCMNNFEEMDITEIAKKIISCIYSAHSRFGIKVIIDTLRGSKAKKILRLHLDQLPTYGICASLTEKKLRSIINFLVLKQYLSITNSEFPTVGVTEKAIDFMNEEHILTMKIVEEVEDSTVEQSNYKKQKSVVHKEVDEGLFEALRQLRGQIAVRQKVPAFIIFSDATLRSMCQLRPTTESQFLGVSGVGEVKMTRYGKTFIDVIIDYENNKRQ